MCLVLFQLQSHPMYKLIVAANRDEFYGRPTETAHFWGKDPNILAGRDLLQNGTWLGITRLGRFAALTNYRDPEQTGVQKKSRGLLVRDFLSSGEEPEALLRSLDLQEYGGFNLIAGTPERLYYVNNIDGNISEVPKGVHGLSNHFLDSPWPKVTKGKNALSQLTATRSAVRTGSLFELLTDAEQADDSLLPSTGIGLDWERKLSPLFIRTPDYGTRSSTVITVDYDNRVSFIERTYKYGEFHQETEHSFQLEKR